MDNCPEWQWQGSNATDSPGSSSSPTGDGCILCCSRRLSCDSLVPRCSRCIEDKSICSYKWTPESTIALFPPGFNMNDEITLRSADSHADSGGFSKVFRTSLRDGHAVAVKALLQRKETPKRMLLVAAREALTWSRLKHEHIVPLIGLADYSKICERVPSQLCLVSPWMPCGNAMDYLAVNPEANRKIIMLDVIDAVCYLHRHPPAVAHGDIRGSNILIDIREERARALLTDFGLSEILYEGSNSGIIKSTATTRAGHPRWLAPERLFPEKYGLESYRSRSTASDVFEVCRTFLEILSGACPFSGVCHDWSVALMVSEGKLPERPSLPHGVLTDGLWMVMERAWSWYPAHRPSAVEIHTILAEEVIVALGNARLSSLRRISIASMMRLLHERSDYYLRCPSALLAILDALEPQYDMIARSNFIDVEDAALTSMSVLSQIMTSSQSIPVLQKAFNLVDDVEDILGNSAPPGWRNRYTSLYQTLVWAEMRLLGFLKGRDAELQTMVRSHLSTLLANDEIGEACRRDIIQTGGVRTIVEDCKEYIARASTEQKLGLTLIGALTSMGSLETFPDNFIDAGLLSAFWECYNQVPLHRETTVLWQMFLERLLSVIREDDPRRTDLVQQKWALDQYISQMDQGSPRVPRTPRRRTQ